MPRSALLLLAVLVLSALAGAGPASAAVQARWRRPLPGGAVVGAFSYERAAPYERGRRRGVDLAGHPGARVLAACGGVVTYAGRVPGAASGRGVTLRCGRLVATELGLDEVAVARGARVLPGATVGRLAAGGVLRLGARVATDRRGYVDPLALLDDDASPGRPTVAPPPARGRRRERPTPRPVRPVVEPTPSAAPTAAPRTPPWAVLSGAALVATGAGGGRVVRARRRRRARAEMALAQR